MQTPRTVSPLEIQIWPINRFILYGRNPRKNDAVVDRMCSSIREFGFKIPVLARSDGEVVDGHLRIKAARKLRIEEIPVILCDEWTPAQVKAFRLMVNRSVNWASWDDELLALELQELSEADFDLSLTGFDPGEIDALLIDPEDDERANAAPPLPENPVSRPGDLWLCGSHRVLCGDATSAEAVARLLDGREPLLLVTDPPYGIELDSEWRDRAGLNDGSRLGAKHSYPAEPSSLATRGRLVRSFRVGAEPPGGLLLARERVHSRGTERLATDRLHVPAADYLEQGPNSVHANALLVPARAVLVRAETQSAVVRQGR
jgi:hypothetical protein